MRYAMTALLLLLAACQSTVEGTEAGGVASYYGMNPGSGVQAANAHCQKYGLVARPGQIATNGGYLTFSCVKAGS